MSKKVSGVLAGPREDSAPPDQDHAEQEPTAVTETTATPESAPPVVADVEPAAAPLDPQCVGAVDLARAAAVEVGGPAVADHLGTEAEAGADGDQVVTHSFATSDAGYVGWRWAVTVARAEGSDEVTVDEVVLLPGTGALLAPAWVPWADRVQPGDLSPGDLLPPAPDDTRLVPAYADVDAEQLPFDLHRELGLGRPRVLSMEGRADAAERWFDGPAGPDSAMAKAAPGQCGGCGFLVPLAGALGRVFGACANGMAPDDGRVVALTHGCGAHSETVVGVTESSYAGMAVIDDEFEVVSLERETATEPVDQESVPAAEAAPAGVEVSAP